MLGSYAPHPKGEAYTTNFPEEESPSGMLARSGTYNVKSRVVDDDGEVYASKLPTITLVGESLVCPAMAAKGAGHRFNSWCSDYQSDGEARTETNTREVMLLTCS